MARARAEPDGLQYVSPGVGSVGNLVAEYLAAKEAYQAHPCRLSRRRRRAARPRRPGLKIGIEEFEVLIRTDEVAVVRFLERHSVGSPRRVTAVLVPDAPARYGVRWLSVHETPVL